MEIGYKVDHIGFIVPDIYKAVSKFRKYFGVDDWKIETNEPPQLYEMTFQGKKIVHSFQYGIADLGKIKLELIMPLSGESVYKKFLSENHEGLHHICLLFSSERDQQTKKDELVNLGGEVVQSGRVRDRACYYYVKNNGLVLELTYRK